GVAQLELPQSYPQPGWVEHDATRIWDDTLKVMRGALKTSKLRVKDITAIGITNQRETAVIWDRATGKPIHPAIVWQDRRTAEFCRRHQDKNGWLAEKTGLLLD